MSMKATNEWEKVVGKEGGEKVEKQHLFWTVVSSSLAEEDSDP
jgi:hypothetical protein